MNMTSIAAAMLVFALPSVALADPTGTFDVRGLNPDNGGEYTGTVQVTRTGDTYKVVWKIANDQLSGIGVGLKMVDGKIVLGPASPDDIGISIAYGSGSSFGTVVYFEQPDGRWHGIWAYDGWDHISTEDWFPKNRKPVAKAETKVKKQDEKVIKSFESQRVIPLPKPALAGPKS